MYIRFYTVPNDGLPYYTFPNDGMRVNCQPDFEIIALCGDFDWNRGEFF